MYKYKLVVKRLCYEYHFMFKKIAFAAAFAEEFASHMVPCEDDVDHNGDPVETTFTITLVKDDEDETKKEEN